MRIALRSFLFANGYVHRLQGVIIIGIATLVFGCHGQSTSPGRTDPNTLKQSSGSGWDSDIASLPKWTSKDSALDQLGEEVLFGGYGLRPPKGYQLSSHSDKFTPDVKLATYGWKKEGLTPALWLDLMPRPMQEWDEGAAARIKGDLGRVATICGGEAQPDAVEFGNVNGLVTARVHFQAAGKERDKAKKFRGYQIIARDGNTSLDVFVIVSDTDDEKTLEILEASMLTLRRR